MSRFGSKPRLLGMSKRGNRYLRMLLIHGARTALPGLAQSDTPLGRWLKGLLERTHRNVATVALANKLAGSPGRYSPMTADLSPST
jgi:transposase